MLTDRAYTSGITNKLMVRATNNFERQIRVPILAKDKHRGLFTSHVGSPSSVNGLGFDFHNQSRLAGDGKNRIMTGEQMINWYDKVLESVKARYRKLQRFSRQVLFCVSSTVSMAERFY